VAVAVALDGSIVPVVVDRTEQVLAMALRRLTYNADGGGEDSGGAALSFVFLQRRINENISICPQS
jgi:hypothetical protein